MGCRVTRVAKGYMGCKFFKNQNPYTICSGEVNSEGCVFGLQGYKGCERLHGLQIFQKSESLYYMQWSDEFLGVCVWVAGLQGLRKVTWVANFSKIRILIVYAVER